MIPESATPEAAALTPEPRLPRRSRLHQLSTVWEPLRRSRLAVAGLVLLCAIAVASIGASVFAPFGVAQLDLAHTLQPPSGRHLFGTDNLGRDVLSRVLYGGRTSLLVSLAAVGIALVLGAVTGCVAAFVGGWVDELIMRVMDLLMAFPYIVLAVTLIVLLSPGLLPVIIVIAVIQLPQFTRITRAAALVIRQQEYVTAARVSGASELSIIARHILPNVTTPVVVIASLSLGSAMTIEAALGFLGLGIQPPAASWGTMIHDGTRFFTTSPWTIAFPGLFLTLAVLAVNLVGDGVRDALDPRMRNLTRRGAATG